MLFQTRLIHTLECWNVDMRHFACSGWFTKKYIVTFSFQQAFKDKTSKELDLENLDHDTAKKIAEIQLTRTEFAEALGLKPTSIFVRNMFLLVDSDRSGFVSFREFLDFFVVLSSRNSFWHSFYKKIIKIYPLK